MKLNLSIAEVCSITDGQLLHADKSEGIHIQNVVVDSRSPAIWEKSLFIALKGKKSDGTKYIEDFLTKGGKVVLCAKEIKIPVTQIIVENPLRALQQIATHHRKQFDIPVIGITGSNGKTIVKEWLFHVLKLDFHIVRSPKSYNSQIGVPLSVLEITKEDTLGIFEAGISMPGEMELLQKVIQPTIGVFTGIGDAHSANFDSDAHKKDEKFRLFDGVNVLYQAEESDELPEIPFQDFASQQNARLVLKTSRQFGLDDDKIKERLANLPKVSMRMEQINGKSGCILLNDAYSSDLQSLEIALQHIDQFSNFNKKVLFLTPLEDNLAADRLESIVGTAKLDEIIVIGETNPLKAARHYKTVQEYLSKPDIFEKSLLLFKGSRKVGLEKIVRVYADKKHTTRLLIDFGAIRNNLNYVRDQIQGGAKILTMVKAQSYGGGMVEMAKFLEGEKVDYFGVAYADEGVTLRKSGIKLPILVMNPEPSGYDDIIDYDLEPSIYSPESLQEFIHELILKQKLNYPIHIKLDTGMNRLGFKEEELEDLITTLQTQPEVYVKTLFSHLSSADDVRERDFTYGQIRKFEIMTGSIMDRLNYPVERHLANSAGVINYSRAHFDMVRAGIGLFGLLDSTNSNFENALTLRSRVSQVKMVKKGESIGYGRAFFAAEDKMIAVVPIGYADGLRRRLGNGAWSVIINGHKAPIVGNVCMDMCMIDITGIHAKRGDEVQIFGSGNSIFEMALTLHTIPYEIIAAISTRVHRVYLEG